MSLLFALGAGQRRDDRPVELLTIFDIQPPREDETAPDAPSLQEVAQEAEEDPLGQDIATSPAPAPAPAPLSGAPDLAVLPVPEIRLVPSVVPEVIAPGVAGNQPKGEGNQASGDGTRSGTGSGGNGPGGNGSGGNGAGGTGTGSKLYARWAPEMDFDALNALFPDAALPSGHGGHALVKCFVLKNRRVRDCSLVGEAPAGLGFGQAALAAQPVMRVQVFNRKGRRVSDTWVLFIAQFRHPVTKRWTPQS